MARREGQKEESRAKGRERLLAPANILLASRML